jgi:hypothetical protein
MKIPAPKLFCKNCINFHGYERDLKWHRCQYDSTHNREELERTKNVREEFAAEQIRKTIYYFIHTFTPILGKDITIYISKMIYDTRDQTSLWFRENLKKFSKPKKNSTTRNLKKKMSTMVSNNLSKLCINCGELTTKFSTLSDDYKGWCVECEKDDQNIADMIDECFESWAYKTQPYQLDK